MNSVRPPPPSHRYRAHREYLQVFLSVAAILTTFDIQPAIDENGNLITPSTDYDLGMIA